MQENVMELMWSTGHLSGSNAEYVEELYENFLAKRIQFEKRIPHKLKQTQNKEFKLPKNYQNLYNISQILPKMPSFELQSLVSCL